MSRYSQPSLMPSSYQRLSRTSSSQSLSSCGRRGSTGADITGCSDLHSRSQSVMNLMEERLRENINGKLRRHLNSSSSSSNLDSFPTADMPTIVVRTPSTTGRIQRRSRSVSYSNLLSEQQQQQLPTTPSVSNEREERTRIDTATMKVGFKVAPARLPVRSSVSDWPTDSRNYAANRLGNNSSTEIPQSLRWRNKNYDNGEHNLRIENSRSPERVLGKTDTLDSGFYEFNGAASEERKTGKDSWNKSSEDLQSKSGLISFKQPLLAVQETPCFTVRKNAVVAVTSDTHAKSTTPVYQSGHHNLFPGDDRCNGKPSLDVDTYNKFSSSSSLSAVNRIDSAHVTIRNVQTDKLRASSPYGNSISSDQKSLRTLASINRDVVYNKTNNVVQNNITDVINNNNNLTDVSKEVNKRVPENTERRTTNDVRSDNLFVRNTPSSHSDDQSLLEIDEDHPSSSYVSRTYLSLSPGAATQSPEEHIRVIHEPTNSAVSDCMTIDSGIERASSFSSDPRTRNSFDELDDASLLTDEMPDDRSDSTIERLDIDDLNFMNSNEDDAARLSQDQQCRKMNEARTVARVSTKDIARNTSEESMNTDFGQTADYRKQPPSSAQFLNVPKPRPSDSVPLIHSAPAESTRDSTASKNLIKKGDRVVNSAAESIRQASRLEEKRLAMISGAANKDLQGSVSVRGRPPPKQLNFPEKVSTHSTVVATGGGVAIPRRSTDFRTLSKSYESSSLQASRTGSVSASTDPGLASCNVGKIIDKLTAPKATTSSSQKTSVLIANPRSVRSAISHMEAGNVTPETSSGTTKVKDRSSEISTLTVQSSDNISRKRRELLEQNEFTKPNTSSYIKEVSQLNRVSQSKPLDSQNASKIDARVSVPEVIPKYTNTMSNRQTPNNSFDQLDSQYTAVTVNTSNQYNEISDSLPSIVISKDSRSAEHFPQLVQLDPKLENIPDEQPSTPGSSYRSSSAGTSSLQRSTPPAAISPSSSFTDAETFSSASSSYISPTSSRSNLVTEHNTVVRIEKSTTPVLPENLPTSSSQKRNHRAQAGNEYIDVELLKGATGLGFCIEGGLDSATGDCPITVKRLYSGATSARELLQPGDVLISVNDQPVSGYMTHFAAWNYLKALQDGIARITIRRTT